VVADLEWRPDIVQGAFMSRVPGGGAAASAGYHDLAGCLDIRIYGVVREYQRDIIRTLREHGAAAWRRDATHGGMDPHIHFVLGTDYPLTPGAAAQWRAYIDGRDGLADNGPDYEFRPDPLVLTPPEDDVPLTDEDAAKIAEALLDGQTVTLRKADGTTKEIPVRNALERILNEVDR
jgi:hypothetical protein